MATRKVKHQRALEKREAFLKTVHQGNQDWLKSAQTDRIEKQKEAEKAAMERKKAKSKRLAEAHKSRPQAPDGVAINAQYAKERRRA